MRVEPDDVLRGIVSMDEGEGERLERQWRYGVYRDWRGERGQFSWYVDDRPVLTPSEWARTAAFEEGLAAIAESFVDKVKSIDDWSVRVPMTPKEASAFRSSNDPRVVELKQSAAQLCKMFPWGQDQAEVFLLTGRPPEVSPLVVQVVIREGPYYNRSTVTMEIEPWVSAETVLSTYRYVQDAMLKGASRTGKRRRMSIGPNVVRFVLSERWLVGAHAFWRELCDRWNAEQDDTHREFTSAKTFQQAFKRALTSIMRPHYTLPKG